MMIKLIEKFVEVRSYYSRLRILCRPAEEVILLIDPVGFLCHGV